MVKESDSPTFMEVSTPETEISGPDTAATVIVSESSSSTVVPRLISASMSWLPAAQAYTVGLLVAEDDLAGTV